MVYHACRQCNRLRPRRDRLGGEYYAGQGVSLTPGQMDRLPETNRNTADQAPDINPASSSALRKPCAAEAARSL